MVSFTFLEVMAVLKYLISEELFCIFLLTDSNGRLPSCKLVLIKNKCEYFSAPSGTTFSGCSFVSRETKRCPIWPCGSNFS